MLAQTAGWLRAFCRQWAPGSQGCHSSGALRSLGHCLSFSGEVKNVTRCLWDVWDIGGQEGTKQSSAWPQKGICCLRGTLWVGRRMELFLHKHSFFATCLTGGKGPGGQEHRDSNSRTHILHKLPDCVSHLEVEEKYSILPGLQTLLEISFHHRFLVFWRRSSVEISFHA